MSDYLAHLVSRVWTARPAIQPRRATRFETERPLAPQPLELELEAQRPESHAARVAGTDAPAPIGAVRPETLERPGPAIEASRRDPRPRDAVPQPMIGIPKPVPTPASTRVPASVEERAPRSLAALHARGVDAESPSPARPAHAPVASRTDASRHEPPVRVMAAIPATASARAPVREAPPGPPVRERRPAIQPIAPSITPAQPAGARPARATPASERPPSIQVTIGRVEIRATVPAPGAAPAPAAARPRVSLDDYLKRTPAGAR